MLWHKGNLDIWLQRATTPRWLKPWCAPWPMDLPRGELAPGDQPEEEAPPNDPVLPGVAGDALLVEDDDNVAALTEEMLSHLGWRVTRVASAEAALNAIQRFAFDLVFSDVMMPGGKSGIELARVLKAQTNAPPIVLASGYSESVRVEAEDEGVPLLSKPFDINALAAILDAARLRRYQIVTR